MRFLVESQVKQEFSVLEKQVWHDEWQGRQSPD